MEQNTDTSNPIKMECDIEPINPKKTLCKDGSYLCFDIGTNEWKKNGDVISFYDAMCELVSTTAQDLLNNQYTNIHKSCNEKIAELEKEIHNRDDVILELKRVVDILRIHVNMK